jgi:hypothetical protein
MDKTNEILTASYYNRCELFCFNKDQDQDHEQDKDQDQDQDQDQYQDQKQTITESNNNSVIGNIRYALGCCFNIERFDPGAGLIFKCCGKTYENPQCCLCYCCCLKCVYEYWSKPIQ